MIRVQERLTEGEWASVYELHFVVVTFLLHHWHCIWVFVSVADLYDDHALPATAAQSLLCKAARKRKEVRRSILAPVQRSWVHLLNYSTSTQFVGTGSLPFENISFMRLYTLTPLHWSDGCGYWWVYDSTCTAKISPFFLPLLFMPIFFTFNAYSSGFSL